jgi:hypothetical protein
MLKLVAYKVTTGFQRANKTPMIASDSSNASIDKPLPSGSIGWPIAS